MRFVGFDSKQQKTMSDMLTKKRAIEIKNCEMKPSRRGDKMEILLKSDSKINASDTLQKYVLPSYVFNTKVYDCLPLFIPRL